MELKLKVLIMKIIQIAKEQNLKSSHNLIKGAKSEEMPYLFVETQQKISN